MENRVGDRRGGANDTDFAKALDAERRHFLVGLVDEDDLDIVDVSVRRNVVTGKIMVHEAAEPVICQRLFVKRHTDTHHDPTENLASRRLGVQNSPRGDRADDLRDSNDAELLVDASLGEHGRAPKGYNRKGVW